MDRIVENLLLANILMSYMILKIKIFFAYLEFFFIVAPPHNGPIKKIFH
jgi:hypothetical protein